MKKNSLVFISICFSLTIFAQQKEGKVIYQRTMQMQIQINDNDHLQQMMPKSRTDKFELTFGNNQSLWKHVDEDDNNDEMGGGGMQLRMVGPGQNDIVFHDFTAAKRTEQRDMMDKKFIVTDSIRKLNWKLTGETETMLGHVCQKAIAKRTGKRTQMTMDNGKMERKEINDTTNMVAWFTNDIPVPAGPEVQGQLPGLILGLEMNNGRMVYKALEISPKVDVAGIKEPNKGKKVTPDEFVKEREKMMAEMQKNNQGNGNRVIRIQN
ncbi:MAG: GLPGLI family protein [Chitinophagaceae bacterium]